MVPGRVFSVRPAPLAGSALDETKKDLQDMISCGSSVKVPVYTGLSYTDINSL